MKNYRETMNDILETSRKIAVKKCSLMGFPKFEEIYELIDTDKTYGTNYVRQFSETWRKETNQMVDAQDEDFQAIRKAERKILEDLKEEQDKYNMLFMEAHEKAKNIEDFKEKEKCYAESNKKREEFMNEQNRRIDEFEKQHYASKASTI
jgi:hypothetical protein